MLIWIIVGNMCMSYFLYKIILQNKEKQKRDAIFEKWIFDSLYSINNKVKLPETTEKKVFKRAKISSTEENPMNEFNGMHDDRYLPLRQK